MSKLGGPKAVDGVINALNDSDPLVCQAAVRALGKLSGSNAVDRVINALNDSDSNVRLAIIAYLRELGGPKAAEMLFSALKDSAYYLRTKAAEALGKFFNIKNIYRKNKFSHRVQKKVGFCYLV